MPGRAQTGVLAPPWSYRATELCCYGLHTRVCVFLFSTHHEKSGKSYKRMRWSGMTDAGERTRKLKTKHMSQDLLVDGVPDLPKKAAQEKSST